jgi:hypothetical protein
MGNHLDEIEMSLEQTPKDHSVADYVSHDIINREVDAMTFDDAVVDIKEGEFRDPIKEKEAVKTALDAFQPITNMLPDSGERCEDDFYHSDGTPKLPDSGGRREFSTGSVRDIRTGKGRFDLISPIALLSLATRLEDGMEKYGERNWEKGQPLMSYLDSCLRHINKYIVDTMQGKIPEEDHISAAFWNLHSFIHTEEMVRKGHLPASMNDLPTPEKMGTDDSG